METLDNASESDSSMVSTAGNYDWNEIPGCSQFPNQPCCPEKHQLGCMLWTPLPRPNEQPGCSTRNEQDRPKAENKEEDKSSDDGDGESESQFPLFEKNN